MWDGVCDAAMSNQSGLIWLRGGISEEDEANPELAEIAKDVLERAKAAKGDNKESRLHFSYGKPCPNPDFKLA